MASEGSEAKSYSTDPALYIYTSLTAGSSHIVTATSRLETILRANRVPFKAIDIATDEKARMLWGRRAGKDAGGRQRKLPGLVQMGMVLGDLVEIEEWNEYGELKDNVTFYYDEFTQPPISQKPPPPAPKPASTPAIGKPMCEKPPQPSTAPPTTTAPAQTTLPIRSIAEEAAQKAKQVQLQSLREKVHGKTPTSPSTSSTTTTKPTIETETKDKAQTASPSTKDKEPTPLGLQSPDSKGWKSPGAAISSTTTLLQSPTTTSWKTTDLGEGVTELHGSIVARASPEEIAAVERAETIKEAEEEDEDESEEEEEEDEDESEEEEEKKGVKGKGEGK